ncbi:3-deoxy-D-manno-octulosonic acid transferase [Neolewinella aurantiaca]|uniref:3-deoxy-D-manno-octulosonic acid transferase n=1 Tax=Neolewinella aurantiaca TaxID=2602767 RepID=A0A5C7FIZ1_9BACT|nr:glycosyltransferase N-terminal domain-containing protein [Neolewinella aurantiaca]TXF86274.1 3-deoxy-D-manno-octulosonic acid transferase [Neolewinella aurantiaca]
MTFFYRIAVTFYHLAVRLAALFGVKQARLWVEGRKNTASSSLPLHLRSGARNGTPLIWMHCASLGEFEQGRPVLEELRSARPDWRVLLTFYSPSGFERCKDEPLADHVAYLPADGPRRATQWLEEVEPEVAIFVKYEFWYFHLRALHQAAIPTFLIAASFRPSQWFFRSLGGWWRRMLGFFTAIIVQTEGDRSLLTGPGQIDPSAVIVAGDPRMDRTLQLARTPFSDKILESFTHGDNVTIIAGSVWPQDVACWEQVWDQLPSDYRLILAPHQLHENEIQHWESRFQAVRYTRATAENVNKSRVLILDTIGILSRAYRYGKIAYVGGGFKTGLHNTLEPMAYGLPVIFGPKYQKFPEAAEAIKRGGAFSIGNSNELTEAIKKSFNGAASTAQEELCNDNSGAGLRTAQAVLNHLP